jgi:hypothetical protein
MLVKHLEKIAFARQQLAKQHVLSSKKIGQEYDGFMTAGSLTVMI